MNICVYSSPNNSWWWPYLKRRMNANDEGMFSLNFVPKGCLNQRIIRLVSASFVCCRILERCCGIGEVVCIPIEIVLSYRRYCHASLFLHSSRFFSIGRFSYAWIAQIEVDFWKQVVVTLSDDEEDAAPEHAYSSRVGSYAPSVGNEVRIFFCFCSGQLWSSAAWWLYVRKGKTGNLVLTWTILFLFPGW